MQRSNFPWLLANIIDKTTGALLAGAEPSVLIPWRGRKVGFVGVVEKDWMVTLGAVNPDDLQFIDASAAAKEHAANLRRRGAEVVIAITHMRQHNDQRLARECAGLDAGEGAMYVPPSAAGVVVGL